MRRPSAPWRASRNGDLRVQAARPAGAIRHRRSLACVLAAALATLAFGVTTAQAAVIHTYEPVASEAISKGVPKGCGAGRIRTAVHIGVFQRIERHGA